MYVADKGNDRIVELAQSGEVLRQWGSRGAATGAFTRPPAWRSTAPATCSRSTAKTTACEVFDADGRYLAKWGLRGTGLGDFSQPSAIAVDCAGNVYVADTNNNRVERFNPVEPKPTGCLAPGTWPPPLDVAPVLRVGLPRRGGCSRGARSR